MDFARPNLRAVLRLVLPDRRKVSPEPSTISRFQKSEDRSLYFVICDYGLKLGRAYNDTDPEEADRETVIAALIDGDYFKPIRIMAVDTHAYSLRDATAEIIDEIARRFGVSVQTENSEKRRAHQARAAMRCGSKSLALTANRHTPPRSVCRSSQN